MDQSESWETDNRTAGEEPPTPPPLYGTETDYET
jgi:hypothetical protein